jgi:chromate transport protein ChrA
MPLLLLSGLILLLAFAYCTKLRRHPHSDALMLVVGVSVIPLLIAVTIAFSINSRFKFPLDYHDDRQLIRSISMICLLIVATSLLAIELNYRITARFVAIVLTFTLLSFALSEMIYHLFEVYGG